MPAGPLYPELDCAALETWMLPSIKNWAPVKKDCGASKSTRSKPFTLMCMVVPPPTLMLLFSQSRDLYGLALLKFFKGTV